MLTTAGIVVTNSENVQSAKAMFSRMFMCYYSQDRPIFKASNFLYVITYVQQLFVTRRDSVYFAYNFMYCFNNEMCVFCVNVHIQTDL